MWVYGYMNALQVYTHSVDANVNVKPDQCSCLQNVIHAPLNASFFAGGGGKGQ